MMKIRILQSKTDQLRKEDELVIARTGNHTWPVSMMERYMNRKGMSWYNQFRKPRRVKTWQTGKISYTCLRELFKKKISDLGLPPSIFGLYSLRASGVTASANAKVPGRLFMRHG